MSDHIHPSKQFLIRGGIALGIVALILLIQTNWLHRLFQKKNTPASAPVVTVSDITAQDSNGNGIPDWEERLWGLDPTVLYTNGVSNKEIIDAKKKALGVTDATTGTPTNETDAIAQKLFSITTALSQNSTVDDASLQKIATQLGSSVNIASVGNTYSLKNIRRVATSPVSLTTYYKNFNAIITKTDLNQEDVTIIVNAAETGDYTQLPALTQTGATYLALAKQLNTLAVPIGVAQYHLDIINSFAGMATSFTYLQQMPDNGTQALVGVALYKVYSTRGQTALYNLHDYLVKYGILSS